MRIDALIRASALVALTAPLPVFAAEQALSLDDAVARALKKNGNILIETEGLAIARAGQMDARSIYDPVLHVENGWQRTTQPVNSSFSGAPPGKSAPTSQGFDFAASVEQLLPTGGKVTLRANGARQTTDGTFSLLSPAYSTRVGLEFRQPLMVLLPRSTNATKFRIRVAALDRDRAAASLRREITDDIAAVERAYWALGAARREVVVREEAVALAQQQLGETETRVEEGVTAEAERAQPRAELERRRGDLLASREAVARAESALKLLVLGDDDNELWTASLLVEEPEVKPLPLNLEGAIDKALAARPEIAAAKAGLERRRLEAALAHDDLRPSLDAVASYDRYGLAGARNPAVSPAPGSPPTDISAIEGGWGRSLGTLGDFGNARLALVLQVPVGNHAARAAAAVAQSVARQAETQWAQARNLVRSEVLDASAALQTAEQRIAATRAAREAAEVQLSAEQDRFAAGLSTNFLVLTRQNDLSRARLDEIAAGHDYQIARTSVARATGSLLEERGIAVAENGK